MGTWFALTKYTRTARELLGHGRYSGLVRQTPKFEQVTGHVTFALATFEPYIVTRTQCPTGVLELPERLERWEASGLADYRPVQ